MRKLSMCGASNTANIRQVRVCLDERARRGSLGPSAQVLGRETPEEQWEGGEDDHG